MTNPFWKILCCFSILTILPACFEQVGTNASGPTGLGGEASTSGAAGGSDEEEEPVGDEGEEGDAEKRPSSAEAGDATRARPVIAGRGGAFGGGSSGGGTFGDGSSSRGSSGGGSSSGSVADAGGAPPAAGDTEAHPSYTAPTAGSVASAFASIQAYVVKEDGSMIDMDRLDMKLALLNPETGEEEDPERYCLRMGNVSISPPEGASNDATLLPRWSVVVRLSPFSPCSGSLAEAVQRKIVLKGSYIDRLQSFEGREFFSFPPQLGGGAILDPFVLKRQTIRAIINPVRILQFNH